MASPHHPKAVDFLAQAQRIATERGGRCLSTSYIKSQAKLAWECSKGHQWEATFNNVKGNKRWCPLCSGNKKGSLKQAIEIAASRSGFCLSKEYRNATSKLLWECSNGHRFSVSLNKVKSRGTWCPECSSFIGERLCRIAFQTIFSESFPRARPNWLRSNGTLPLELDGYSRTLAIAFEHQGRYHYSLEGFYSKDEAQLDRRRSVDELKRKLCEAHGVRLFLIPEVPTDVKLPDLQGLIAAQAKTLGIALPVGAEHKVIDYQLAYKVDPLATLRGLAETNSGRLLSKSYLGNTVPLKWSCEFGHIFELPPTKVKAGRWCQKCAYAERGMKRRLSLEKLREFATSKGGDVIGLVSPDKELAPSASVTWRCVEKHKFNASWVQVKGGKWCSLCKEGESLNRLASSKGISYLGGAAGLPTWRCKNNHEWTENSDSIRRRKYACLECGEERAARGRPGRTKYSASDFQALASSHGGKCLITTPTRTTAVVRWECAKGHRWDASLANVAKGTWCPYCAHRVRLTIQEMKEIASARGGECISARYVNAHHKLRWRCRFQHEWYATPAKVKAGRWCPRCKNRLQQ